MVVVAAAGVAVAVVVAVAWLCLLGTVVCLVCPLSILWMMDGCIWHIGGMVMGREDHSARRNPLPVPHVLP
jgi:hypothetical protein